MALSLLQLAHKLKFPKLFGHEFHQPKLVMGIDFANPVGIAAGLDKNGDYLDALATLGGGFIEVGTVTPKAQAGNRKPRLFRLTEHASIINHMGFNNKGVDYLVDRVAKSDYSGALGINIGKNTATPTHEAVNDYLYCLRRVYPHADYIVLNISCPNTSGGTDLQYGRQLAELLMEIKEVQLHLAAKSYRYVPLAIKVGPNLNDEMIATISEQAMACDMDAIVATNTSIGRDGVEDAAYSQMQGGLSGRAITQLSTDVVKKFHQHLQTQIPIIAVGGIMSPQDALDKLTAGAELVQMYSGLIYHGPGLIHDILAKLESDYGDKAI